MRRIEVALVMLATAGGGEFTPVQIQKALFLLDREAADLFDQGERYHFRPYDYGPFDRAVYDDLEELAGRGLAEIARDWTRKYRATPRGVSEGERLLHTVAEQRQRFVQKVSEFVRTHSFSELVTSIYRAYPDMQENSIFVSG
jgi:uncharacterized protein YwgA